MKTSYLITAAALFATGSALAAELPNDPIATSGSASVQRAEVIAETERAMASGDLKFGPLVDYLAQFTPPSGGAPQASRLADTRGALPQGQPVAMEGAKPAQPMQPPQPQQTAQK